MSLSYIRKTYGVPAKRGAQITYSGGSGLPVKGIITSARGAILRVRLEDGKGAFRKQTVSLHPTWRVDYADAPLKSP